MSAVRLWRWAHNKREFFALIDGPDAPNLSIASTPPGCDDYIALPAAEHAALVALLGDLQEYLDTGIVDVPRAVALSNRVTQALAGLGCKPA